MRGCEEFLRGEFSIRPLVAEKHPDDRRNRKCPEDQRLLGRRKAEARQVAENEGQPCAPDKKFERHHDEQAPTVGVRRYHWGNCSTKFLNHSCTLITEG